MKNFDILIRVLGKTYKVISVDPDQIDSLYGLTLLEKGKIILNEDMSEEIAREIKIHELLHAIWGGMDIGYSDSTEEKIVSALAKGLAAFITDNHINVVCKMLDVEPAI